MFFFSIACLTFYSLFISVLHFCDIFFEIWVALYDIQLRAVTDVNSRQDFSGLHEQFQLGLKPTSKVKNRGNYEVFVLPVRKKLSHVHFSQG